MAFLYESMRQLFVGLHELYFLRTRLAPARVDGALWVGSDWQPGARLRWPEFVRAEREFRVVYLLK